MIADTTPAWLGAKVTGIGTTAHMSAARSCSFVRCRMAAVGSEDWYRASTWDAETANAFEKRIVRSRAGDSRSQYLRIQGSYLIKSSRPSDRQVGRDLLRRAI